MNPFKSLLLAVDFTEHSKTTLNNTIQFAKKFDSSISLIHVITDFKNDHEKTYNEAKDQINELKEIIKLKSINAPHIKVSSGMVENETTVYAKDIGASVIVIGSGNKGKGNSFRLGHHAESILRNSETPTLIIKGDITLDSNTIACPIDFSNESLEALNLSIKICQSLNLELCVVHCVEPAYYGEIGTGFDYAIATQNLFEDNNKAFDEYLKKVDFGSIVWHKKALQGIASQEISKYVNESKILLTIMRSTSRSGISRLILGSVAESITKNSSQACLIIK